MCESSSSGRYPEASERGEEPRGPARQRSSQDRAARSCYACNRYSRGAGVRAITGICESTARFTHLYFEIRGVVTIASFQMSDFGSPGELFVEGENLGRAIGKANLR